MMKYGRSMLALIGWALVIAVSIVTTHLVAQGLRLGLGWFAKLEPTYGSRSESKWVPVLGQGFGDMNPELYYGGVIGIIMLYSLAAIVVLLFLGALIWVFSDSEPCRTLHCNDPSCDSEEHDGKVFSDAKNRWVRNKSKAPH